MNHATFDGLIYVLIALFGALGASLGTDDAAKYIDPATLWYAKNIATAIAAALLALKMFRSTTFSDAKDQQNGVTKVQTSPPVVTPETSAGATVAKVVALAIGLGIAVLLFTGCTAGKGAFAGLNPFHYLNPANWSHSGYTTNGIANH